MNNDTFKQNAKPAQWSNLYTGLFQALLWLALSAWMPMTSADTYEFKVDPSQYSFGSVPFGTGNQNVRLKVDCIPKKGFSCLLRLFLYD